MNTQTISKPVQDPSELPKWNYDGSSTGQAPGEDSEVILYPQAIFKDPFRGGNNILLVSLFQRTNATGLLKFLATQKLYQKCHGKFTIAGFLLESFFSSLALSMHHTNLR
nr:plastid glutamine synthetase 2 [Ipomoea batatas]